jgi:hypothetical protein
MQLRLYKAVFFCPGFEVSIRQMIEYFLLRYRVKEVAQITIRQNRYYSDLAFVSGIILRAFTHERYLSRLCHIMICKG